MPGGSSGVEKKYWEKEGAKIHPNPPLQKEGA